MGVSPMGKWVKNDASLRKAAYHPLRTQPSPFTDL